MEDDLKQYLRSRDVPEENIILMEREKIDRAVLSIMTDEQVGKYIPSYGDRIAVHAFCQRACPNDKESLLMTLREKISARKMKSRSKPNHCTSGLYYTQGDSMARKKNNYAEKTSRKIEIGWLNFSGNEYHQVRTKNGGGTRQASVEKSTTVSQILDMGKKLFFPNGCSPKGPAEDFTFDVTDFKNNKLPFEDTVGSLYDQTRLKIFRFYICTKHKAHSDFLASQEIEDSEGQYEESSVSTMDTSQVTEYGFHNQLQPSDDGPVSILNIVDLTSSTPDDTSQTDLENNRDGTYYDEVQQEGDTVVWDPEEGASGLNDGDSIVTLNYDIAKEHTQTIHLVFEPSRDIDLTSSSAFGIVAPSALAIHEGVLQDAQDSGLDVVDESMRLHSSSQVQDSGLTLPAYVGNQHRVSVHRIKVVEDLIGAFLDDSIMSVTLKMEFVNENAVDDSGVSREVYTAFWESFLEQAEGESERVPRLRPDFNKSDWQAVGRIWVKGLLDHGVMPVRLSKAFTVACMYGIESVDIDVLMSSFFNYIPAVERSAVERALQGSMEEDDKDDMIDLFTRMGSHVLPNERNVQTVIETVAHKTILQEPKYIIDCLTTPMAHAKLNLPDKKDLLSLYERKKATGKRVLALLEPTKESLSQKEQTTFNYLQLYVKSADQVKAEKILRFCTGSSVICVERIMVSFNIETGLSRRPVGHTCGATLEVPCTYCSYPDFRAEFDCILSSNFFEMDII